MVKYLNKHTHTQNIHIYRQIQVHITVQSEFAIDHSFFRDLFFFSFCPLVVSRENFNHSHPSGINPFFIRVAEPLLTYHYSLGTRREPQGGTQEISLSFLPF